MDYKKIIYIIIALSLMLLTGCGLSGGNVDIIGDKRITRIQLPNKDFTDMDFFDDGYEIVEFKSLADGDTATFVVGDLPISTRFLAIDTPETSSTTDGMQPWALAAKEYTKNKLENANQIILELDEESDIFDNYNRLLAWVWVDGELLNYDLVKEGLAYVKYLYGDYKYNSTMISLESAVQKTKIKIWGEVDPSYDYEKTTVEGPIAEARKLVIGANVSIRGIVTNVIDKNAFIQDETGGIYIYANKYNYGGLVSGNEVALEGKLLEYNGLLEVSNIVDKKITVISENNKIIPLKVNLSDIGEDIESQYISVSDVEITDIIATGDSGKEFSIIVKKNDVIGVIRIDKYLKSPPDVSKLKIGQKIDVIGNVGQHMQEYQIVISSGEAIK